MAALLLQDVKRGRYPKLQSAEVDVLAAVVKLGVQIESRTAPTGVTLLPVETVQSLMLDKRKVCLPADVPTGLTIQCIAMFA